MRSRERARLPAPRVDPMLLVALLACPDDDPKGAATGGDGPVDADADGYLSDVDCDDADADVFPGAVEVRYNGKDDDCDPATCYAGNFAAEPTMLTLPEAYGDGGSLPFASVSSYASCDGNTPAHTILDMSGDGALDLVVTFVCGDDEATGDTRWLVHPATADGFAESASDYGLPGDYGAEGAAPFANIVSGAVCGDGIPAHDLTDLDGDLLADLVITEDCDDEAVGATEWRVHAARAAGFAEAPASFALPGGYGEAGYPAFTATSEEPNCAVNIPGYALADINGDRLPDLVVTETCTETATGDTQWLVYLGNGSGLETAAIQWSLPAAYGEEGQAPFTVRMGPTSCGEGIPGHMFMDMDGDDLRDLVITETCDGDLTVGDTRWLVHRNTGTGFASDGLSYALPAAYGAEGTTPFSAGVDLVACGDGTPGHSVEDIDGDGITDLILMDVCDDLGSGAEYWYAHLGDGSTGFAEEAYSFALPAVYATGGLRSFASPSSNLDCNATRIPWSLFDWDKDGDLDLLVTGACIGSGAIEVGDTTWLLHTGDCVE